jgi:cob(I)alamin adenosyltransferase
MINYHNKPDRITVMKKGKIHIYTGNGKGKTTAALGLALRAAGAGMNVFIGQFMKRGYYSEIDALAQLNETITVRQYGSGRFVKDQPHDEEIESAQAGLEEISKILQSGHFDVVIMDEACTAMHFRLFKPESLMKSLEERNQGTEVIITGRNAPPELIDMADLVTEMREIKHYYRQGVKARKGIEK